MADGENIPRYRLHAPPDRRAQFAAELADALDDAVERYDQRYGQGGASPGA